MSDEKCSAGHERCRCDGSISGHGKYFDRNEGMYPHYTTVPGYSLSQTQSGSSACHTTRTDPPYVSYPRSGAHTYCSTGPLMVYSTRGASLIRYQAGPDGPNGDSHEASNRPRDETARAERGCFRPFLCRNDGGRRASRVRSDQAACQGQEQTYLDPDRTGQQWR